MPILATPPEKSLDYEGDLRWSSAINTEATDHVPPYGVCYAVGIDDQGNIEVAAPNVDGVEVLVADSMGFPVHASMTRTSSASRSRFRNWLRLLRPSRNGSGRRSTSLR